MAKKRAPVSRTSPTPTDWELWDHVAASVQPMDRSISPLARARNRSLSSSAQAGETDGASPDIREQTNRAVMEAYLGTRSAAAAPVAPKAPTKRAASDKSAGSPAIFPENQPTTPFLPYWQPPAQRVARKQEPIDRKTKRKLSKGRLSVDARIDLHGMTQDEAHNALIGFVGMSHARGHRVVLVITGKGLGKQGKGILRQVVPRWLVTPPLAQWVNGHDVSAPHHGGDGALYVRLRRQSAKQTP
ncbi:MAG: Smr/MutS family protein [Pseudomonadota bacterium]